MNLSEKIKIMIREVGIVPMICDKTKCDKTKYYDRVNKHIYCNDEIPFIYKHTNKCDIMTICHVKVDEYYKK